MRRHGVRVLTSVALAVGVGIASAAWAGPAAAVATTTVALWNMNEPPGSSTAADSSGNGLRGTVGADVRTGVVYGGATGYRFPSVAPNSPPTRPGHLVTVPNDARLNPGSGDFTVTVRLRTTRSPSNIVQKGQSATAGGFWKIEQDRGRARCTFRGGNGQGRSATASVRIDDGRWHTVVCERTAASVTIYVDGVRRGRATGPTGTIANSWALAIGGKSSCDQQRVGCDYFSGDIDYVRVQKG